MTKPLIFLSLKVLTFKFQTIGFVSGNRYAAIICVTAIYRNRSQAKAISLGAAMHEDTLHSVPSLINSICSETWLKVTS